MTLSLIQNVRTLNGQPILQDTLGLIAALGLALVVALFIANLRLPKTLKYLFLAGLAMRVVGAAARYYVLAEIYRGVGDARGYFGRGMRLASAFHNGNWDYWQDTSLWDTGTFWGTQFVRYVSGVVLTFLGPTFLGEFIVFSLFPFIGLMVFSIAFARAYPHIKPNRYIAWIMLFPSLWFWPSSVGKEAIMLMGIGLTVGAFIGRGGRINWLMLTTGFLAVFAIRVQVAAVLMLCLVLALWLSMDAKWTLGRLLQGVAILGIGIAGIYLSIRLLGIESMDSEGLQGYVEGAAQQSTKGGSQFKGATAGLTGVPMALVNILFRPFPWEATSFAQLLSSAELVFFWGVVWVQRRRFLMSLRYWRSDSLLRFSLLFILLYTVPLGMSVANMGIIARQRVFLFPFLFVLLEAMPIKALARQRAAKAAEYSPPPAPRPIVARGATI